MGKVSIIISACNEHHTIPSGETVLQRTVRDVYEKAKGEIEVLVGFNGLPYQEFPDYPNLVIFKEPENIGLKPMLNRLAEIATGEYLFKLDAHCMVGPGFDEILQKDMRDNWIVTPRFYVLDAKRWKWQDDRFYDYFYLSCPFTDPKGLRFKAGGHWEEKTLRHLMDKEIDETPSMHGSGWFVKRDYFLNVLNGFPKDDPMGHAQEPIWLGLKNWLMGGKLMVNKKTWYAHMHQNSNQRGYSVSNSHVERTYRETASYWIKQPGFKEFVKKFMPMPTWPENWESLYEDWKEAKK